MADIKNPRGMDAVIFFDNEQLDMVFQDDFEVLPGQSVEWVIRPSKSEAWMFFDSSSNNPFESPFDWQGEKSFKGKIRGTIKRDAVGVYKYSVRDAKGNTIDPRFHVKR
jgi:hypothetical protein